VALAEKDGDDIIVDVYDNVHEELRAKTRALEKQKQKVCTWMYYNLASKIIIKLTCSLNCVACVFLLVINFRIYVVLS
jgi:hypothetical protein